MFSLRFRLAFSWVKVWTEFAENLQFPLELETFVELKLLVQFGKGETVSERIYIECIFNKLSKLQYQNRSELYLRDFRSLSESGKFICGSCNR